MKASDLFIKALENEGVQYIFGVPGEENLDFLNSLKESSIQFIITRHEQAAGFMAATYGRLTGKTGVCLSTLGPGATNLMTAAAYAHLGGMPMLMITGQKPIRTSKQGHFQIVDIVEMMRPVTKLSQQIVTGNRIPSLVREAFRLSEEERPGATLLELPEDVAADDSSVEVFPLTAARRPVADEKAVLKAVAMIEAAKHPLILIGAGANRKRVSKMLHEFILKTGIPFFTTQMGKGVIDERSPLYLGTAAISDNDYVHCAIKRADLIINVGHDVVEKPPFVMRRNGTHVIHINFYSTKIDDVYFPQHEVLGDIANALWQIMQKIQVRDHWDFAYFLRIKSQLDAHLHRFDHDPRFPMIPQRIVAIVRDVLPSDGIVCLDNGMYKLWFARHYRAHGPNTLLVDNALATMGAGLPSAIATKLVHPEKMVLAVCGDGGFMMNSQELETAVRLKLHLVALVLNDNGFGMIQWKQDSLKFERFGLSYGNPDFKNYAESYGARGYNIESADQLAPLIQQCFAQGAGVHLIEVPVDYSENMRVLSQELLTKTCNV